MKHRLRYAHYDLGEQQEGATAVVRLRGSRANVILLDTPNFARYRWDQPFEYVGGQQRRSPVRLRVPCDGHWHVVVDLGGFGGRVQAAVSVLAPDGSPLERVPRQKVVDAEPAAV